VFRQALAALQEKGGQDEQRKNPLLPPVVSAAPPFGRGRAGVVTEPAKESSDRPRGGVGVDRATARRGLKEIEGERERIARLAGIREIVFGGQDGLISTTTLVAGIAATTSQNVVVLVAGAIATVAGALSMGVGSYLASRAQRQLYEAELASEQREIAEKPGEEMAELLAALIGRGMPRQEAIAVTRSIAAHPNLMIELLGAFELGLIPEGLGSPIRDAIVTAVAFMAGSVVPLLPFLFLGVQAGLVVTMFLALAALFTLGALKARLSGRTVLSSGLEVVVLGGAAGGLGYALGRVVSALFGISI
jgi:VIT1/CCC1 family predicted Fe2+/Mn2+ transporter